jgi:hypothetical protein
VFTVALSPHEVGNSSTQLLCTKYSSEVRFQVLTAASVRVTVIWDTAPCSFVEVDDVLELPPT